MSFWSQASVEPKRQFRWLLYLSGMPQFIVTNVKKPSFNVGSIPYNFLNYEFKYPGRVTWQPINFTVIDPVTPDSAASLFDILTQAGYVIPPDYNLNPNQGPKTISKENMVKSLGSQIKIAQLDDLGAEIETFTINNPQITSVDFGQLDYSQEGMVNITVTLAYDWATIQTQAAAAAGQTRWDINKTRAGGADFVGDNQVDPTIIGS